MRNVTALAFGLCMVGGHAMAAQTLTGAQTKELVSGHTFAWKSMKYKASGVSVYAPDGGFTITTNGKIEKGRWYMKGNKQCDQLGSEKETCSTWQRVDDKTFYLPAYQATTVRKK